MTLQVPDDVVAKLASSRPDPWRYVQEVTARVLRHLAIPIVVVLSVVLLALAAGAAVLLFLVEVNYLPSMGPDTPLTPRMIGQTIALLVIGLYALWWVKRGTKAGFNGIWSLYRAIRGEAE